MYLLFLLILEYEHNGRDERHIFSSLHCRLGRVGVITTCLSRVRMQKYYFYFKKVKIPHAYM